MIFLVSLNPLLKNKKIGMFLESSIPRLKLLLKMGDKEWPIKVMRKIGKIKEINKNRLRKKMVKIKYGNQIHKTINNKHKSKRKNQSKVPQRLGQVRKQQSTRS